MKIKVNTKEFKNAFERVFKVIRNNQAVYVLENILLTTQGNELYLSASNLEQSVKIKIASESTADIKFGFSDTKSLLKAMKFFADDNMIMEYMPGKRAENGKLEKAGEITVICGGKKATQIALEADQFPLFPTLNNELNNTMLYNNAKLKERFNAISYAVSTDNIRPTLKGICFRNSDMAACDGYRFALNKDEEISVLKSFVVPCAAIEYVNNIMGETLLINTDNKYIQFIDGDNANTTVISRLYEGDYMDYSKTIQERGEREVEIDIKEYVNSLKYLKTFVPAKTKCLVNWFENKVCLETSQGYYESEVVINRGNMDIEICFNGDYMREALSQFKDKVTIYTGSDKSPMMLISESDVNNIALVLPVRLKNILFKQAA
jgi:DNA polymerase-3 subunit beta